MAARALVLLLALLCSAALLSASPSVQGGDWRATAPTIAETWSPAVPFDLGAFPSLPLRADGSFRALVLTDLHLGLFPWIDAEALRFIDRLAAACDPDLILCAGDNSHGPFSPSGARKLVAALEATGRPWLVVLGNHDAEGPKPRSWFGALYAAGRGSLFSPGPRGLQGVGNGFVWLREASGKPVFAFVALDSNEYRSYPGRGRGYDLIHPDQIAWYEWIVRGLSSAAFGTYDRAAGQVLPTLLLFHIPLPQVTEALADLRRGEIDPALVYGLAREAPCPPLEDSGLFDAVLRLGSTKEILVGHDHRNDLSLPWKGVRLSYIVKTGPADYHDEDLLGGTLVTVSPSPGPGQGWVARSEAVILPRRP